MARLSRHSAPRRAAWLTIFALLLQAIVPTLHHPAGLALDGIAAFAGAKNLCMAPGSAPVTPDDPDKAPHHHQTTCALCQAAHATGGLTPPVPVLLATVEVGGAPLVTFMPVFVRQRSGSFHQPRGPPASI